MKNLLLVSNKEKIMDEKTFLSLKKGAVLSKKTNFGWFGPYQVIGVDRKNDVLYYVVLSTNHTTGEYYLSFGRFRGDKLMVCREKLSKVPYKFILNRKHNRLPLDPRIHQSIKSLNYVYEDVLDKLGVWTYDVKKHDSKKI